MLLSIDNRSKPEVLERFFSPYALLRVGGMPFSIMDMFRTEETFETIQKIDRINHEIDETVRSLDDWLHEIIRNEVNDVTRKRIIQYKRLISKHRLDYDPDLSIIVNKKMDDKHKSIWNSYIKLIKTKETLSANLAGIFQKEMDEIRENLQEKVKDDEFRKGILLSSTDLFEKIGKYIDVSLEDQNAKLRKIEKMLMAYLSRVATKTSPFSTFTPVSFIHFKSLLESKSLQIYDNKPKKTQIKINHLAIGYLLKCVEKHFDIQWHLPIKVNPNLKTDNRKFSVFQSEWDLDVSKVKSAVVKESVVNMEINDTISGVIQIVKQNSQITLSDLSKRLLGSVQDVETLKKINSFLQQLVSLHVLKCEFPIPDQSQDIINDLIKQLQNISSDIAVSLSAELTSLRTSLNDYIFANLNRRKSILEDINAKFKACCTILGVSNKDFDPILFEDTSYQQSVDRLNINEWSLLQRDFEILQTIMPLFAINLSHIVTFKEFFKRTKGENGSCDDLVALFEEYRLFTRSKNEKWTHSEPKILEEVKELKNNFIDKIFMQISQGNKVVQLESEWLQDIGKKIPESIKSLTESYSYFVQPYYSDKGNLEVVINRIASGYGQFMSRFISLHQNGNNEKSISDEIREVYQRLLPPNHVFAEISGVFGFNGNLHESIAPFELTYPGTNSKRESSERFVLEDLKIIHSQTDDQLHLVSKETDQIVHPVYLGFLSWYLLPTIYKLLFLMVPPSFYSLQIHAECYKLFSDEQRNGTIHFPRIKIGDIIISREQWWIPNNILPDTTGMTELQRYITINNWRNQLGIPDRVFLRVSTGSLETNEETNQVSELNKFSDSLRKPQFIDFSNPFLIKLFEKNSKLISDTFIVEEMLPNYNELFITGDNGKYVSELVIEFNGRKVQYGN